MYLLYLISISLILPYVLQTHPSQNIHTYFSYIFELLVSQSNYIQDPYSTKYLHIIPIRITNTISHKTYIFFTIFIHLKRYQTLFQEHITKALLMESNITHIWLITKRTLHGKHHFKCMIKGINLINLCTRLNIFSLPPVAPIFPHQLWSHHEMTHNIILYRWTHFIMLLKYYKSTNVIRLEPQTMKISHYIFISIFTLLNIFYFIIIVLLYSYYFADRILLAH